MADASNLASLNSATLGAKMPEVTLPDGTKVQTGTVGALLINVKAYNEAHAAGDEAAMAQAAERMRPALPLLDRVGLFGLFTPDEWIAGDNEGRRVVGQMFVEFKKEQQQQK